MTANVANLTALYANGTANYANATANIANLTANVANLTANYANGVANYANATANIANLVANYANATANIANLTATNANVTAQYLNDNYTTLNEIYSLWYNTGAFLGWKGGSIGGVGPSINQVLTSLNVGINLTNRDTAGLESASNALEVNGTIYATNNVYANNFLFGNALYLTSLPIASQWTTGTGNIYIQNSNVGIGTSRVSNALDVIGNVYISGNLQAGGDLIFDRISTSAYYYLPPTPIQTQTPSTYPSYGTSGDYIIPLSAMTCDGYNFAISGNRLKFTRAGLYNIMTNIQGVDANNEFDSAASVSVWDITTTATLIFRDTVSTTFGTQKQTILIPLSVTDINTQYQLVIRFFRDTVGHTINSGKNVGSYVLISPLAMTGISFNPGLVYSDHFASYGDQVILYNGSPAPIQGYNRKLLDVRGDIMLYGGIFTNDVYNPTMTFDRTNQDVRIRNSNLYVKTDDTGNAFSVDGNVFVSGNLYTTGLIIGDVSKCIGLGGQWTTGTANIYIQNSNVGIGTSRVSNALDVVGNVFVSSNITALSFIGDISKCSGFPQPYNQWSIGPRNTVYLLNSNVGIGTGTIGLSNALEVSGNVVCSNLIVSGKIFGDISGATGGLKQWNDGVGSILATQPCIVYPSNVRIGFGSTLNQPVSNSLDVLGNCWISGNIVSSQYIYGNVSTASGLPFVYGIGNVYSLNSNVGIGTSRVSNALDVVGNVFVSGRLSANTQLIVACSDENSYVFATTPIMTFRTPSKWLLTACPRITVKTAGVTGGAATIVDVTYGTTPTPIVTGINIPGGSLSSALQAPPPTFSPVLIPDDTLVSINVTSATPGITGLKIIFYYMIV